MNAPTLPSAQSALSLMGGDPTAFLDVAAHTALRAGLIAVGLYLSGRRRGIFRTAAIASLSIEAFVLAWAAHQVSARPTLASGAPALPPASR